LHSAWSKGHSVKHQISKYEARAKHPAGINSKQAQMFKIEMTKIFQIVIANEVKQSREIATLLRSSQ
jgi:hypothetical protein